MQNCDKNMCGLNNFIAVFLCAAAIVLQIEARLSKRQTEDTWSWGLEDTLAPSNSSTDAIDTNPTNPALQPETTPSFCLSSYVPPTKPDYRAPGRRISEAKCLEFVWELNNRVTTNEQDAVCSKYRKTWGSGLGLRGRKREQKPGEFPHMCALGWKAVEGTWIFKCGCSLISEKFVLTAAHCTKASAKDTTIAELVPKIVRISDMSIVDNIAYNTPPKKDAMIARIIIHPQFTDPNPYYDIALIELDQVVEFTKFVQPACLWNKFDTSELGTKSKVSGWGVIESDSLKISPKLQVVTVDRLESDRCDELLMNNNNNTWKQLQKHQLCAEVLAGGVNSCQGDSGGPLQMKMPLPTDVTNKEGSMHYVIGIISFGVGCGHPNLPGVYTRVSSFIDWIEDNVWNV